MLIDPYATGVLDKDVHPRLVADIENIAYVASIQPKWIWTPLADTVPVGVISWVTRFKHHEDENNSGLCLTGPQYDLAANSVSAIAGALLRNFIDAQVITAQQLHERLKKSDPPNPTCLLIPNFFAGQAHGIKMAHWEITALQDLILDRHLRGRSTVIYATDINAMGEEYGSAVAQLVNAHYRKAVIGGAPGTPSGDPHCH